MLAHNSVDRGIMARDSIELTQYDLVASSRGKSRAPSTQLRGDDRSTQRSAISIQPNQEDRPRTRARATAADQDDSELLINPEDLDLDELDNEEAQFLRTGRRVPVRRSPIPKKTASQLKIAGMIVAVVLVVAGIWAGAKEYGLSSPRFRVESSDAVEITGVKNAALAHVMQVAATDVLGRNIFYADLDERRRQLEQIPWVEHASVMRLLPNRIAVTIEERTPVAFAQIGSRISLIDSNGVVMGMPANRQTKYSFPVIRGIAETEALSSRAAAMKIYNRLVSELGADAAQGVTNYVRQLSEVDLSDPEDVKVTANDPGGTMVVHLGGQDFLPRYKLYVTHIAEWRQQFQNVQSVDLRYEGQVIVNPDKPAASEKTLPRIHGTPGQVNTNNADRKPVVKPVAAKQTAKPISAKPVVKPVSHKVVAKQKKHLPQRTQRAQR